MQKILFGLKKKDLNTSSIGLDNLKEIAVELNNIEKFFECLEDTEYGTKRMKS